MMSSISIKTTIVLITFFILGLLAQNISEAQVIQWPQHLQKDPLVGPYIEELDIIFEGWNTGDINFPSKSELKPEFDSYLARTVKARRYPYQDEKWAEMILEQFNQQDEELVPKIPIDESSVGILKLLFVKDLKEFADQVSVEETKNVLMPPLFLILGRAQKNAIENGLENIGPEILINNLLSWWTTVWPICGE